MKRRIKKDTGMKKKNKKSAHELFEKFNKKLIKNGFSEIVFNFDMYRESGTTFTDVPKVITNYEIKFREVTYGKA